MYCLMYEIYITSPLEFTNFKISRIYRNYEVREFRDGNTDSNALNATYIYG